jgi:hypothetical protein
VRNESGGEEKREEEKKNLLGVASASIGFNAVLLMSVTKPVSFTSLPMSTFASCQLFEVASKFVSEHMLQFHVLVITPLIYCFG